MRQERTHIKGAGKFRIWKRVYNGRDPGSGRASGNAHPFGGHRASVTVTSVCRGVEVWVRAEIGGDVCLGVELSAPTLSAASGTTWARRILARSRGDPMITNKKDPFLHRRHADSPG